MSAASVSPEFWNGKTELPDEHIIDDWPAYDISETAGQPGVLASLKTRKHFISSRFLGEAYRRLIEPIFSSGVFKEEFLFVAGYETADGVVWDYLAGVEYEEHSACGVLVDQQSCSSVLTRIRDSGQYLVGHLHSHPGHGPNANRRSEIDERFADRLARGQSIAIGGIFSRSKSDNCAYLRFFASSALRYEVTIIGTNVERIEEHEHSYKLRITTDALAANKVQAEEPGLEL